MGKKLTTNNPNLGTIRRAVRELGGEILSQVNGVRHLRLRIRTKSGAEFNLSVNLGRVDAKKQTDWVHQQMRMADRSKKQGK